MLLFARLECQTFAYRENGLNECCASSKFVLWMRCMLVQCTGTYQYQCISVSVSISATIANTLYKRDHHLSLESHLTMKHPSQKGVYHAQNASWIMRKLLFRMLWLWQCTPPMVSYRTLQKNSKCKWENRKKWKMGWVLYTQMIFKKRLGIYDAVRAVRELCNAHIGCALKKYYLF